MVLREVLGRGNPLSEGEWIVRSGFWLWERQRTIAIKLVVVGYKTIWPIIQRVLIHKPTEKLALVNQPKKLTRFHEKVLSLQHL